MNTQPTDKELLATMLAIYGTKAKMAHDLKITPQCINNWFNVAGRPISRGWRAYFMTQHLKSS